MTNAHEEGRVYAIDDGKGCVKIGWAKDPVRRLREMNVSDPGRLTLIGSARGTRVHEAEAHALLKPWRERGEWFRKEGHVLTFLDLLPKYQPGQTEQQSRDLTFFRRALREKGFSLNGLAKAMGVDQTTATRWQRRVPAERVLDVERLTGIPREVLRPDIFSKSTSPKSKPDAASVS
jgi:hypothetical protein